MASTAAFVAATPSTPSAIGRGAFTPTLVSGAAGKAPRPAGVTPAAVAVATPARMAAAGSPPPPSRARATVPSARAFARRGPAVVAPPEVEVNEGDPYLRETMRQYVPPLVAAAFVYGCLALGGVSSAVAAVMPSVM